MGKEAKGILKSLLAPPRPLCNSLQFTKIFGEESDDLIGLTVVERANHDGIRFEERHKRTERLWLSGYDATLECVYQDISKSASRVPGYQGISKNFCVA